MAQWSADMDSAQRLEKLKLDLQSYEEGRLQRVQAYLMLQPQAAEIGSNTPTPYWLYDVTNGQPVYFGYRNVVSQQTVSAHMVKPGGIRRFGLTGAGITVGVWDDPVRTSHREFAGRIINGDGADYIAGRNHGTHVAGTVAAAGVRADAQGFAHGATLRTYNSTNDLSEVTSAATAASGVMLSSNHSYGPDHGWGFDGTAGAWRWWGGNSFRAWEHGAYTEYSRQIDDVCFNLPNYLMVRAAGNERGQGIASGGHFHGGGSTTETDTHQVDGATGYECIPVDIACKNVLAVGNVQDIPGGYNGPASVVLVGSSSTGPTDDGRIKPDLVANGAGLLSSVGTHDSAYASASGTSMAAPSVTGSVVLLQQMWYRYFATPLRGATVKALLVHTTDEAGPNPGPDYQHGWGLLNVDRAARLIHQHAGIGCPMIYQGTISSSNTLNYTVYSNGTTPLKATLVWHEPGATNVNSGTLDPTASYVINNLDLQIISPLGGVTRPWVLNRNSPAAAATRGINNQDNVEQVLVPTTMVGNYTVRVTAPAIAGGGTQPFSLIITGFQPAASLTLNNATLNAVFSAGQTITVTGNSTNGTLSPAALQAGISVDLKPGFSAVASRHPFDARILTANGCHVE